ncbi:MAG TPA: hypothetical protein VFH34_07480 [Anaerolineales bacterium]|nr:hypothetical protein [Anaerolineales bacterium]
MPPANDIPKNPYSLRRLMWIAAAAVLSLCACLGFIMFANRDNPSAVPTLRVEDIATAATSLVGPPTPESGQFVHLTLNPTLQNNLLMVEGNTDLPNRTILMYEVREVSAAPKVASGTMPVLDGRYARQVNLTGWNADTIVVWVGFQTLLDGNEEQPQEVIERFGELGEFLYGDNVTQVNGLKRVEISQSVRPLP